MASLPNPTFTSWDTLATNADKMEFTYTGTNPSTMEALVYVETDLWDSWVGIADPTVDELVEIAFIEDEYDGYARAFRITTQMTADYATGEMIGACWYRLDQYISCAAWASDDGAGAYTATSYRAYHSDQDNYDPTGVLVTSYSDIVARDYEGLEENW